MTRHFCIRLWAWSCLASLAMAQWPAQSGPVLTVPPSPVSILPATDWRPQHIHVLLAGDTNDPSVGKSVDVDLRNLDRLFHELVPQPWQLQLYTLRGDGINKNRILGAIDWYHPSSDDAFVFIWSGHGAHSQAGHYFHMPNGDRLYRAEVVAAMQQRRPRLVVLLSGSCNELAREQTSRPPCMSQRLEVEKRQNIAPIAEQLFLSPRGIANINGASEGELDFCNNDIGDYFLYHFCRYLRENCERRISWRSLVAAVSPRVNALMQERFPDGYSHGITHKLYTKQTPRVWSLPRENQGLRDRKSTRLNSSHIPLSRMPSSA